MLQPLHVGNAIRLFLQPPAGAEYWRILKMGYNGFDDPDYLDFSVEVYEGEELVVVDSKNLINENKVFYRPYYMMSDNTWQAGGVVNSTPTCSYEDYSTDVLSFVRQRLEEGLLVEIQRETLINDLGYIQVFTAPPSLEQNLRFPLVTITLEDESPNTRGLGDDISGDEYSHLEDDWFESSGWIADVRLSIVGWSLNSDERITLRKAIRRIIIGNLPVFAAEGMDMIHFSMSDVDALNGEYNANIYQVMGTFTCIAPVRAGGSVAPIGQTSTNP